LINTGEGLSALNAVKELMADLGRPHDNLSEVALWADMLKEQGRELFYAYMVDNQAIVIPEQSMRFEHSQVPRRRATRRLHGQTPLSA
jgi:hypothetical protein